jgi:hypothetical protein
MFLINPEISNPGYTVKKNGNTSDNGTLTERQMHVTRLFAANFVATAATEQKNTICIISGAGTTNRDQARLISLL